MIDFAFLADFFSAASSLFDALNFFSGSAEMLG